MRVRYSFSSRRTGNIENIKKQRSKFPSVVKEVVRISDIILQVLDARFINETRNLELEEMMKKQNKKIIYVVNKIDLVNLEETKEKLKKENLYPYVLVSCTKRIGGKSLRDRIKIMAKSIDSRYERIQVGIIGYPNTGKSSIINFITGKPSAPTASESGFTKGIQKIKLAEGILILDTPGVIPDLEYSSINQSALEKHTKIGVRNYDKVKDPEMMVDSLMPGFSKEIEAFYSINANGSIDVLLEELGRKKNFLIKKGEIDTDRTARLVLKDWQEGKIKKEEKEEKK